MSKKRFLLAVVTLALVACESDNEHFCARYQYVFKQLLEQEDLPSYAEMRAQLLRDMKDPKKKKEQAQFMLFVLDDWNNGLLPEGQEPREMCMQLQRWTAYPTP